LASAVDQLSKVTYDFIEDWDNGRKRLRSHLLEVDAWARSWRNKYNAQVEQTRILNRKILTIKAGYAQSIEAKDAKINACECEPLRLELRHAMRLLHEHRIDPFPLITETFPIQEDTDD